MYEIALSAVACLRSSTRADVAWRVATDIAQFQGSAGAVMMTPGGGRIGTLMDGVFEGQLADIASRQLPFATVHRLAVGPLESMVSGLSIGASAQVVVSPADLIPLDAWQALLEKRKVLLRGEITDGVIRTFETYTDDTIDAASEDLQELFQKSESISRVSDTEVLSLFVPTTQLVIAGSGPIAGALRDIAEQLGWNVVADSSPSNVAGLTASLTPLDCVVVMGHDVESSSRCLEYALQSNAGYIGALGSMKMQQSRADWLAYRDVTDLSRVHGPAGFDIGASTPHEIAVSIIAEAVAVKAGRA